ncbi:lipid hydrolase [Paramecium bursaria Chlorella virus NE-JV-1]|nr:lipid hydrolase [Paramecium bursaria Chlorella virus NE-JV-1]
MISTKIVRIRQPESLVIAGGGAKSMSALGAIHVLKKTGHLKKLKYVSGTSAGAIVAAGLALNRDPIQMVKRFTETVYRADLDIQNFSNAFGVDTGEHLFRWIDIVLGNELYTFKSILEKTGITLVVCATNLSTSSAVYFSPESHPEMDVRLAIRMSCSLPIFFSAVRYEEEIYVDGALTDAFPIDNAMLTSDNVLGIRYNSAEYKTPMEISGLDGFFKSLIAVSTKDKYSPDANVFTIDVGELSVLDFKNPKKLKKAFKIGFEAMKEFLKKND